MPYTVAASFDKFRENIELSGDHRETANKRRDSIVSLLSKTFDIVEAFPSGSIPRYTALRDYADLDVFVVLHYTQHIKDRKPSQVLKAVRDALADYTTSVRRNGQAVTLKLRTWPSVDIVPVSFTPDASGSVAHYNVPDTNEEVWIPSNPKTHSEDMSTANLAYGTVFKRIVKMIKWWNHQHSSYLQSYHIEVMSLHTFSSTLSEYPWNVYQFFNSACTLILGNLWHRYGNVDGYLTPTARAEALTRLKVAKKKALDAWWATCPPNSDHEKAIGLWRQIFGDKFPPYGS